jgi:hypothetical protein
VEDGEQLLVRFNRLVRELEQGAMTRNCFKPWEIELLLDMDACDLRSLRKWQVLRQYQKAVRRHLENGASRPLKLSEYLGRKLARRSQASAAPSSGARAAS